MGFDLDMDYFDSNVFERTTAQEGNRDKRALPNVVDTFEQISKAFPTAHVSCTFSVSLGGLEENEDATQIRDQLQSYMTMLSESFQPLSESIETYSQHDNVNVNLNSSSRKPHARKNYVYGYFKAQNTVEDDEYE